MLPVTMYIQDQPSLFMLYSSQDHGQTWQKAMQTDIGDSIGQASTLPAFICPSGAIIAVSWDGQSYRLAPGGSEFERFTPTQTGDARNTFSNTSLFVPGGLSFLDEQHGWGIAFAGGCETFKANCWLANFIEQTDDGGLTWHAQPFGSPPPITP